MRVIMYKNIPVRPYRAYVIGQLKEKLNSITYKIESDDGDYVRTLRRIQLYPKRPERLLPMEDEI